MVAPYIFPETIEGAGLDFDVWKHLLLIRPSHALRPASETLLRTTSDCLFVSTLYLLISTEGRLLSVD